MRLRMHRLRRGVCLLVWAVLAGSVAAQPIGPGMSPIVTFDPDRGMISRPPTQRPLTAAELKLARERAERFWDVVKVSPSFSQPRSQATYLTSWAVIDHNGGFNQSLYAYWSDPRDVRRHKDGALYGVMGGVHDLLYIETNFEFDDIVDRSTAGEFSRGVGRNGGFKVFAAPRVFGELAGGTVYLDMIVFTRDGRSALEAAPLGPLLDGEVATLRKRVATMETDWVKSLQQLEASMTPQSMAERLARREARFRQDRPRADEATMQREMEAAARGDEFAYRREKERLSVPATRDPKSIYWGPRLALDAVEQRLGSLDATAREAPACGRIDPAFRSGDQVRFEPVSAALTDCVPMVRVRRDLIDRKRPITEVQLMTIWFRERRCGVWWGSGLNRGDEQACRAMVALLREVDGAAVRRAVGW